jgi:hypothetical protein
VVLRRYTDAHIISSVNVACSLLERQVGCYWIFKESHKRLWVHLVRDRLHPHPKQVRHLAIYPSLYIYSIHMRYICIYDHPGYIMSATCLHCLSICLHTTVYACVLVNRSVCLMYVCVCVCVYLCCRRMLRAGPSCHRGMSMWQSYLMVHLKKGTARHRPRRQRVATRRWRTAWHRLAACRTRVRCIALLPLLRTHTSLCSACMRMLCVLISPTEPTVAEPTYCC